MEMQIQILTTPRTEEEIRARLFELQDAAYRDFQAKLIPGLPPDTMIGVRTPALRNLAKEMAKELATERGKEWWKDPRADLQRDAGKADFLEDLPHPWFDENQLHAFLIAEIRDIDACLAYVERFLPYIDNWATCDQLSPKVFRKNRTKLLECIRRWIRSDHTYTVRFAIGMLMQHFLDEDFDPAYPDMVAAVRSDEYYINMMIAWYFATALAKQPAAVLPYIEGNRLAPWTHNKAIQKAVESYRISPEMKERLREKKRNGGQAPVPL